MELYCDFEGGCRNQIRIECNEESINRELARKGWVVRKGYCFCREHAKKEGS
jgi:hypothetical protein